MVRLTAVLLHIPNMKTNFVIVTLHHLCQVAIGVPVEVVGQFGVAVVYHSRLVGLPINIVAICQLLVHIV